MIKMFQNITILLAEDEKRLANLMKSTMGEYFHDFIVVHNGEDALKAYHKYYPDILITDIMMPKLTGLELMKELREIDSELPIIILSAYSDSDRLLQAINFGITKYFIKPFDPDELIEYLSTLIPKLKKSHIIRLKENFNFNIQRKELYLNNAIIKLTKREITLLTFLLKQKDYIANSKIIKKVIWNKDVTNERLRTFIRRLRAKTSKELILNSSSLGYSIATY